MRPVTEDRVPSSLVRAGGVRSRVLRPHQPVAVGHDLLLRHDVARAVDEHRERRDGAPRSAREHLRPAQRNGAGARSGQEGAVSVPQEGVAVPVAIHVTAASQGVVRPPVRGVLVPTRVHEQQGLRLRIVPNGHVAEEVRRHGVRAQRVGLDEVVPRPRVLEPLVASCGVAAVRVAGAAADGRVAPPGERQTADAHAAASGRRPAAHEVTLPVPREDAAAAFFVLRRIRGPRVRDGREEHASVMPRVPRHAWDGTFHVAHRRASRHGALRVLLGSPDQQARLHRHPGR